jgi:transposase InsO family protein
MLMRRAGIKGLPGSRRPRPRHETPTPGDLVNRDFTRAAPNLLWVTDITEHPTREGKVYCAVVLDTFSRKVVGWSIDSTQTATPVTNALSMAISNRQRSGTIIHSDHGVQFASWVFTRRVQEAGLAPSMGSIGDCYDNGRWSRSGTACRPSCSTGDGGAPASNRPTRSSSTWRSSTTGNAATARWECRTPIEYEKLHPATLSVA